MKLLQDGCVVASGNFNGSTANNIGSNGNWWSSTPNNSNNRHVLNWNRDSGLNSGNNNNRNNGQSIRCVLAS